MTQSTQGLQLEEALKDNERMKEALRSNDQEVDGLRREMARVADEMRAEVREVEQEFAGKLQQAKE
jgi:phage host-nuclease inhibitor protein Gam